MEERSEGVEAQHVDSMNSPPPATITLSGTVSEFVSSGYDSAALPQKRKMQWKQFFLGLFLPYAVGFVVILLFFVDVSLSVCRPNQFFRKVDKRNLRSPREPPPGGRTDPL